MTRIVLVDDNRVLVRSLVSMVPWAEHGIEVAGCAFNGEEAIPLLNETVDVLITDIRMPRMDGIKLTNWVAEHLPHVMVIFLSAYSEFEYAVNAIKMRVWDYVCKPVDHAQLLEAIGRAAREKQRRQEAHSMLEAYMPYVQERMLTHLLLGDKLTPPTEDELAQVFPEWDADAFYLCVIYEIRDKQALAEQENLSDGYAAAFDLKKLVDRVLEARCIRTVVLNERIVAGVFSFPDGPDDECMEGILKENKQIMQEAREQNVDLYVGMSTVSEGIDTLSSLLRQAQRILGSPPPNQDRTVLVYPIHDDTRGSQANAVRKTLAMAGEIAAAHDRVSFHNRVDSMLRQLGSVEDGPKFALTAFYALSECVKEFLLDSEPSKELLSDWIGIYSQIMNEPKDVGMTSLRRFLEKRYEEQSGLLEAESKNIIAQIQKAIRLVVFDANGGLQEIARQVCFSPSYVSMIFKQYTGQNIITCIQQMRLKRAKELLADGAMKVYEVSDAVGYSNPYYFSVWFKKKTGYAPSDFQNLCHEGNARLEDASSEKETVQQKEL